MGIHRRIESHLGSRGAYSIVTVGGFHLISLHFLDQLRSLKKTERLCSFEVPLCPELRPTCTFCGHLSILGTLFKKKKKSGKKDGSLPKKKSQQPIPNPFLTWPWHDLPPACPGVTRHLARQFHWIAWMLSMETVPKKFGYFWKEQTNSIEAKPLQQPRNQIKPIYIYI